jgi:hypothetical protein
METAEHREPYESRGSRTDLGAPGSENPPGDSTAAQLIALSALWSWLASYLNRTQQLAPESAGLQAALVVLAGAIGSVVLGAVVDRAACVAPAANSLPSRY